MGKVKLSFLSAVICLSMLLSACASATPATEAPTVPDSAGETAGTEGKLVRPLVLAWYATPPTIDGDVAGSLAQIASVNTCETLVAYKTEKNAANYDVSLINALGLDEFEGRLAESWTLSEDGKVWTFKLREGVLSNYGNELTAEDVRWSYERSWTVKGVALFLAKQVLHIENPEDVKVIDKYTVQFTTSIPNQYFLPVTTIYAPCIHDSTELKKHVTAEDPFAANWTANHNATFGPWQMTSITPGVEAIFEPNPNYYRGMPYYSKVIWREVPISANRMALLKSGDVDIAFRLSNREKEEVLKDTKFKNPDLDPSVTHEWRLNFNVPPFDNKLVRQAMAYAFPYKEVHEKVYYGTADEMKSFIFPWAEGYDPTPWTYTEDLEKAKSLLEEAGFGDGFEFTVSVQTNWPEYEEIAVLLKANLEKIGVTMNIDKNPEAVFNQNRYQRTLASTIDDQMAIYPQAVYAAPITFAEGSFALSNFNNFANDRFNELIDAVWVETDPEARAELIREEQEIIAEEVGWVYIAIPPVPDVLKAEILGWTWYPDNHVRWFDLYEE